MNLIKFNLILITFIFAFAMPVYAKTVSQDEITDYIHEEFNSYPYDIEHILKPLIYRESRFNVNAVSQDGKCKGLTQVNPNFHEIEDPFDYRENIKVCADYLKEKIDEYGSPAFALMCWNCGEQKALELKKQNITTKYAKNILKLSKERRISDDT